MHLLDGEFTNVSAATQQNLPPCPPTNDHTESDFGKAKQAQRRSPNANLNTIKGLLQFNTNQTADNFEDLKQKVPDLISTSMKKQRVSRKFNTKKKAMIEIGQKKEQAFFSIKIKKDERREKKEREIQRLQQIIPWDLEQYNSQREVAKLGDLREQLQIRKRFSFQISSRKIGP